MGHGVLLGGGNRKERDSMIVHYYLSFSPFLINTSSYADW